MLLLGQVLPTESSPTGYLEASANLPIEVTVSPSPHVLGSNALPALLGCLDISKRGAPYLLLETSVGTGVWVGLDKFRLCLRSVSLTCQSAFSFLLFTVGIYVVDV